MFKCPVCGNNSYTEVLSEMFKCDNCSVLFGSPIKFGKGTNEPEQKDKPRVGVIHRHPGNQGGIVSQPIKLSRG